MLINIDTSKSVDNSVINMFIMAFTRTYDKKTCFQCIVLYLPFDCAYYKNHKALQNIFFHYPLVVPRFTFIYPCFEISV